MKYTTEQLQKALQEGNIKAGDTIEIIEKKEKYFMPKKRGNILVYTRNRNSLYRK